MGLLLALSLLAAQDGLSVEAPKGWARKQDPTRTIEIFTPPGLVPPKDATVLVYPPADATLPIDAWLDQMVQNLTKGKRLQGAVQKVDVGIFRVAVFSQQTPQGWTEHLALHAVRWGDRGQAVLFAASDADLFKEHAGAVAAALSKVARPGAPDKPASTTAIAGLNIPFPADWTRQTDSGWVVLTPPPRLSFGNPRVWVGPSQPYEGSPWTAHREFLKALTEKAKFVGAYTDSVGASAGPFIRSTAHNGADARTIVLWTAAAGGRMETVVLNPTGGDEMIAAMLQILAETTLRNATGEAPKRPEIVEAYRRPNMKKYVNLDGSFYYGRLQYERVALLSNGVVDFTVNYAEGFDACPALTLVDAGTLNGYYGKWSGDGKELRIQREPDKAAESWTRENGNLRFGDQTWTPLPRVDGLKLKGRYSYKSDPGPGLAFDYWAEFAEDGTFKCADLLTWLAVSDFTGRPKPPDRASGTYEIRNWTIWFKVDGKPVWSTDFQPLNDDAKDLGTVLLNTYSFKRQ